MKSTVILEVSPILSIYFSHTLHLLWDVRLQNPQEKFSLLLYQPCLVFCLEFLPHIHIPSSLLYHFSHAHLSQINSHFRVWLKYNKISPSKNSLCPSLRMNSFFYCITTAILVHTRSFSQLCLTFQSFFPCSIRVPWVKGLYILLCFARSNQTRNTDEVLNTCKLLN